jgi:hypothetical protein
VTRCARLLCLQPRASLLEAEGVTSPELDMVAPPEVEELMS